MVQVASDSIRLKMAGFEQIVLVPYQDGKFANGLPKFSIGLGHHDPTMTEGSTTITVHRAFELFAVRIAEFEKGVRNALRGQEIPQHHFDAFVSLHYQSGNRYMPAIVHLYRYGEKEGYAVMRAAFLRAAYTEQGEFKNGLEWRRQEEMKIFDNADYGDLTKPIKVYSFNPKLPANRGRLPEDYHVQEGDLR